MLSKEARKEMNIQFYEGFKNYMRRVPYSGGGKPQWASYRTGIKDFYVRTEVDQHGARFCLDYQNKDEGIRTLLWEQLEEFSSLLNKHLDRPIIWVWEKENAIIPSFRLYTEQTGVSFYNKADWDAIYAFFKTQLVAFDEFWEDFSDPIKALMD